MTRETDSSTLTTPPISPQIEAGSETKGFWRRAWEMYRDGFKNMGKTGKQLWLLILIKLFIMFAILRAFLFPNFLNTHTDGSEDAKSDFVTEQFVDRALK